MKTITKTSRQSQLEKSFREFERSCPECKEYGIGITISKTQGFFNVIRLKQTKYSCFNCGCKWETIWK